MEESHPSTYAPYGDGKGLHPDLMEALRVAPGNALSHLLDKHPEEAVSKQRLRSLFCVSTSSTPSSPPPPSSPYDNGSPAVFLNHGAFGGPTLPSMVAAMSWETVANRRPLAFYDRLLFDAYGDSVSSLASFLGPSVDAHQLHLTQNPTSAINALVAHYAAASPGKPMAVLSTFYGSVGKTVERYTGQKPLVIPVPTPSFHAAWEIQAVIDALDKAEAQGIHLAGAVLDHVSSNQAYLSSLPELAAIFRQRNIPLVIDGAHGPLAQDLSLVLDGDNEFAPDAYVGSAHKWMAGPRGVGFFWLNPSRGETRIPDEAVLFPPVVSHGYDKGTRAGFAWDGTRSYAPALALPVTCAVWEALGVEDVRTHMHDTLRGGAEMLASRWGTSVLFPSPVLNGTSMAVVGLPPDLDIPGLPSSATIGQASALLQDYLFERGIEVPIKTTLDRLHVRISAHLYNSPADYQALADVVEEIRGEERGFEYYGLL